MAFDIDKIYCYEYPFSSVRARQFEQGYNEVNNTRKREVVMAKEKSLLPGTFLKPYFMGEYAESI